MTFLKLNNITVPVTSCAADHGIVGGMSRALGGDLLSDVRAVKRVWKMTTQPMTLSAAYALSGMLTGRGQLFTFDEDSYSASGFAADSESDVTFNNGTTQIMGNTAADGDAVKNLHAGPSDVADVAARTACVSADDASVNILAADLRDMEGTPSTDWAKIAGSETFADDTTNYLQGSQSLQITHAAGGADYGATKTGISVSAATDHTLSLYIKSNTASHLGPFRLRMLDTNGGSTTVSGLTLPSHNVWYRVWASGTTGAGAPPTMNILLDATAPADAVDYSVDAVQLEAKAYQTAWVDGTRSAQSYIYYPSTLVNDIGAEPWSVAFWSNGSAFADSGTQIGVLFDTYQSLAVNRVNFQFTTSSVPTFAMAVASGTNYTITGSAHSYGEWKHYACVYDAFNLKIRMFVNGVESGSGTSVTAGFTFKNVASNYFAVGNARSSLTRAPCGQIDDFMVLPYALTATEAAGLYNSGTAPTIGYPRLVATGDFAPAPSVTVRGAKVRTSNIYCNGSNNYKVVDFELQEV